MNTSSIVEMTIVALDERDLPVTRGEVADGRAPTTFST